MGTIIAQSADPNSDERWLRLTPRYFGGQYRRWELIVYQRLWRFIAFIAEPSSYSRFKSNVANRVRSMSRIDREAVLQHQSAQSI